MSLYLDCKYLNLISNKLDLFKKVNTNLWNFRCPICGDSKIDKTKARGYFYTIKGSNQLFYKCHNCGYGTTFQAFLKSFDQFLYRKYLLEKLSTERNQANRLDQLDKQAEQSAKLNTLKSEGIQTITNRAIFSALQRVDTLDQNHFCKKYVDNRKISQCYQSKLYYCEDFRKFVNSVIPNKFQNTKKVEQRLIIPYFDKNNQCIGFQGRSLDPNETIRYITIKLNQQVDMIYGLDTCNFAKTVYVTEGPIDSMFIPNCLAVSGSSYDSNKTINLLKQSVVIVPDNERRNPQTCNHIKNSLNQGFKVVLWPEHLPFKDINEAIIFGYSSEQLLDIINNNIVEGYSGLIRLNFWRK